MEVDTEIVLEVTCPKCGHKFTVEDSTVVDIEPEDYNEG